MSYIQDAQCLKVKERNDSYCSPNEIDGHVAQMGEWRGEVYARFWLGNLKKRDYLEDPGVDGRIILRWIFRE